MAQVPPWATDPLSLQHAEPLREIEIGGTVYALGALDEGRFADLAAHCARVIERTQAGLPLAPEDQCPSRALQHLLYAGDPEFQWRSVVSNVTSDQCALGAREYMRQAVIRALRAGPGAAAANMSEDPGL